MMIMSLSDNKAVVICDLFSPLSSSTLSSSSSSSSSAAPACNGVTLATVVKTTSDVSWSLAAMQAYQTLGCQSVTPGATGFGSTAFYGQSPSPYSNVPAASYVDGLLRLNSACLCV